MCFFPGDESLATSAAHFHWSRNDSGRPYNNVQSSSFQMFYLWLQENHTLDARHRNTLYLFVFNGFGVFGCEVQMCDRNIIDFNVEPSGFLLKVSSNKTRDWKTGQEKQCAFQLPGGLLASLSLTIDLKDVSFEPWKRREREKIFSHISCKNKLSVS